MPRLGNRHSTESAEFEVPKRMLTVVELAIYLGIPKQRIYVLTHTRKIPFHRIGRTVLFDRQEIDKWLSEKRFPAI